MESQVSPVTGTRAVIAVLALAVAGAGAYGVHERNQAQRNSQQNAQLEASLKTTNTQLEQLTAKVTDLTAPKPVAEAPAPKPANRVAKLAPKRLVRGSDGRWKAIQSKLDAQGKEIEATRADLANTRTELSGSIARTHDEVVVLQKKGERNIYEFDILKTKQFQPNGPVGIKLKKANTKRQYADLELIVDDVTLQKKHVNLYEPAVFYSADSDHPVELVINQITKDRIHGYVSAPKYRRSELTATTAAATTSSPDATAPQAAAPQKQRQKLQLPN